MKPRVGMHFYCGPRSPTPSLFVTLFMDSICSHSFSYSKMPAGSRNPISILGQY